MALKPSFSERLKRKAFIKYRELETSLHELKSVLWECTLKCNLNCGHCGSDCKAVSSVPDADKEVFFKALIDIKKVYKPQTVMVGITGGEPLLRKDLPQIIKTVSEMGFPVGIVSNGFALNPQKFAELVNNGLGSLTISLDGLEKEHNELRNNEKSFAFALRAIKNASLLAKEAKGKINFSFDVVSCIHPSNVHTLPQIRDLLIESGVKNWRIFSIFPTGRSQDLRYNLSKDQFKQMMDFIEEERRNRKIDVSYSCEGWLGNYETKVRPSYFFCRAGITNVGIFADGKVGGCISSRSNDFIAGDLNKSSFIDIWENGFDLHRNREWAKKGKCENCKAWKNCLGNGLHLYNSTKDSPMRCSLEMTY